MKHSNESKGKKKIFIPIIIVSALIIVAVIALFNKGNIKNIGETTKSNIFEMTFTSAEFVDKVNMKAFQDYRTAYKTITGGEDFCLPVTEDMELNEDEMFIGKNGNAILAFTFEYKFIGTENYEDIAHIFGEPTVTYDNNYEFNGNYFVSVKDPSYHGEWLGLCTDISETIKATYGGKDILYKNHNYRPLETNTYYVRGFIAVPEEVKENTDKPLTIKIRGFKDSYKIR